MRCILFLIQVDDINIYILSFQFTKATQVVYNIWDEEMRQVWLGLSIIGHKRHLKVCIIYEVAISLYQTRMLFLHADILTPQ